MGEPKRDRLAAALKVTFTYTSIDEFVRESCNDISLFGIFVKTKSPLKEGVTLELDFQLDNGRPVIRGLGQVVWRREIAQSDDRPSGMGIKFLKLDSASRYTVERAVEARGLAPSRFDRLGDAAARATSKSERLVHKRTSTPTVTVAEDGFDLDKSLSLSLDPAAGGSWPVDTSTGPPRYSFTRDKTVSAGNQETETNAWSSEELENLERAFNSPSSAPEETALPLEEKKTTVSPDWDVATGGYRPVDSGSSASLLPLENPESVPNQEEEAGAWSSEELESLERAFSLPANAREEADLPPDEKKTNVIEAPITAQADIWEGVRARQAAPRPPVHDSADRGGTILPPLPRAEEGQRESAKTGPAAVASIRADFREQIRTDPPEPVSERFKVTSLRERLAKQAASAPPLVSPDHESALRLRRLAELSMAELRHPIPSPQGRGELDVEGIEERASETSLDSVQRAGKTAVVVGWRAMTAILHLMSWVLPVVWRLIVRTGAIAAVAVRAAIVSIRAMPIQRRRALAISALMVLLLVGGASAYQVVAPKAWRAAAVWGDKTNRALIAAGAEFHRSVESLGVLVEALSESEQSTARRSTRYLLKIVTQPAGATALVASKHYITPCEVELAMPESALRIHVRRNSYRSIQRRITAKDFRREGNLFAYTLNLRLEKLPSNTPRTKSCTPCDTAAKSEPPAAKSELPPPPPTPTAKRKPLTIYLEPMPEFTKPRLPATK